MKKQILSILTMLFCFVQLYAQQKVGINIANPVRTVDVSGTSDQYIRVHSSSFIDSEAGIEFVRGINDFNSTDWRIVNDGSLKFFNSDDNLATTTEVMRINSSGYLGIGTTSPFSKLHANSSSLIVSGGAGIMKIGNVSAHNLGFDATQIIALNDGDPAPLSLQANGGNTNFGLTGGDVYMALGGGAVGVGTEDIDASLTIEDAGFQMTINNDSDDDNQWHIGASSDTWQSGDDQLVFSPSSSSGDAVLRLMDVTENDGTNAPVMIHSTSDQTILMDGNEIDTRNTPLYINHNSNENTLINPSGGRVGIGTTNPQAMLHVYTAAGTFLSLQRDGAQWNLSASPGTENFNFYWDGVNAPYAEIDGVTGQWMHLSDRDFKENIQPLRPVMNEIKDLNVYSYSFINDQDQKRKLGVIAQEAEPLFPEIVKVSEGQYGVSYGQLAALGIKAIQEQQALIEELRIKIDLLRPMVNKEGVENNQIIKGTN